jgi:hypothetical protein
MSLSPASTSVPAGQAATFNIDVNPNTGAFPSDVGFSCSKLPALTTCRFSPTQVASGNGDSLVTLTISTTAPIPRAASVKVAFAIFPFAGLVLLWMKRRHRLALTLMLAALFTSCGGGLQGGGGGTGSPGTPPGTYAITVTATSGIVTHAAPLSLTVTP